MAEQTTGEDVAELLRSVLGQPELFAFLVEERERQELPPGPFIWMLKLWGTWHGFYPADRVPRPDPEVMNALLTQLKQRLTR
jgi:hypothetical protein